MGKCKSPMRCVWREGRQKGRHNTKEDEEFNKSTIRLLIEKRNVNKEQKQNRNRKPTPWPTSDNIDISKAVKKSREKWGTKEIYLTIPFPRLTRRDHNAMTALALKAMPFGGTRLQGMGKGC